MQEALTGLYICVLFSTINYAFIRLRDKSTEKNTSASLFGPAYAWKRGSLSAARYTRLNNQQSIDAPRTPEPRRGKSPAAIDDLDFKLIALLRKDGRMSTRELAKLLGLTEATVRARLRRLEETETMRVVAMTDYRVAGFDLIASIGVQVRGRDTNAVAEDIARLPQVLDVQVVIGASDIELSVAAGERDELALLLQELARIPGVDRLSAGMALDVFKFQWGWVPFL